MKKIILGILIIFISSPLFAQFSLDKFWNIELGHSISSVKKLFPNEKWEEREAGNDNLYTFYGWIEPSSIKVSFLFTKSDQLRAKIISNGKIDIDSATTLFKQLKELLIKKFGTKYEKKDTIGKSILIWRVGKDGAVTLSNEGDKTSMINLEAVGISF